MDVSRKNRIEKRQDFQECRLITCIIGPRARTECQEPWIMYHELQQAAASEQRKTTESEEEDGLLLTGNSIRGPRRLWAKKLRLLSKERWSERKETCSQMTNVQRKSKTELNWLTGQVIPIVWEGSCCIAYSIVTEKERTFEPRNRRALS